MIANFILFSLVSHMEHFQNLNGGLHADLLMLLGLGQMSVSGNSEGNGPWGCSMQSGKRAGTKKGLLLQTYPLGMSLLSVLVVWHLPKEMSLGSEIKHAPSLLFGNCLGPKRVMKTVLSTPPLHAQYFWGILRIWYVLHSARIVSGAKSWSGPVKRAAKTGPSLPIKMGVLQAAFSS